MGFQLDITTMIFAVILGHLFSGILGFAYMVQHKKDSAFYTFFLARLCAILGLLLMIVPAGMITMILGNLALILGEALQILSFFRVKGQRIGVIRWGYPLVASAVAILFFLITILARGNSGIRVGVMSGLAAALWAYPLYVLVKGERSTLLHRVVALTYALELIPLLLRAYLGFRLGADMTPMSDHVFNILFFIMLFPVMLAGNIGFILMSKERSDFELTRAATYDELTNIYNRRTFLLRAQSSIAQCSKKGAYLSFLMMDLDYFKRINDFYGHKLGDAVLIHFAALCRSELRERDLIGRLGGEEFAVVFTGLDERDTLAVAERLRKAVEQSIVEAGQNRVINYTVSIGVVTLVPDEHTTLDMLYKWSDDALYTAKKSGRNRVEQANPSKRG